MFLFPETAQRQNLLAVFHRFQQLLGLGFRHYSRGLSEVFLLALPRGGFLRLGLFLRLWKFAECAARLLFGIFPLLLGRAGFFLLFLVFDSLFVLLFSVIASIFVGIFAFRSAIVALGVFVLFVFALVLRFLLAIVPL